MKIFCSLFVFLFATSQIEALRRWCFYTNWAQYRTGNGKFIPENIDANLCTHISYAFAALKYGRLAAFEWNDDDTPYSQGMYKKVNNHKQQNPSLKTLLAVGGWNMGSQPFSDMVTTKQTRQNFITSTISFLRSRNFDGIDISWEYPTKRGSGPQDKEKFGNLLKELRAAFNDDAQRSGLPRLLIGVVVGSDESLIENGYDINAIKSSVDAVSLLTYDFYTPASSKFAVHTSALHAGNISVGTDAQRNVEYVAKVWVENGLPKDLINIGIALYGHSYRMVDTSKQIEGALVSGPGAAGPITALAGFLAYYEVCEMIRNGGSVHFIEDRAVPYLILGNQWVAFENERSVALKAKFAVDGGYGGVMVWSFDVDDFSGKCPGGKVYPLMNAINNAMNNNPIKPQTTPDPNWLQNFCTTHGNGFFGRTCKTFVICINGKGMESQCTDGQLWDKNASTCLDARLAKC